MDLDADPRLEQLVADLAWVRRLARALVKDDAIADDLAQDAYLVAAERAPADRPLRPWLGRVVLNLVRMRGRSAKRRAARELATGEATLAVPSPEELVARVETQQVVAAEVLALAEPYRATVLLHYVEELSSAEIARRLGIPDATVRRRLKHALDELRARLTARDDAPRRGRLAALAPLAHGAAPSPASAALVGGLVMKKLIAAVGVLVLLLLAGLWWQHNRAAGPAPAAPVGEHVAGTPTRASHASAAWQLPAWAVQRGVPGRRIAGHVVFEGRPVGGATVRLAAMIGDVVALTGPMVERPALTPVAEVKTVDDGSFDLGVQPAATFVISAEADGRSPASVALALADPHLAPAPDQLVLALGGCGTKLSGAVLDASGGRIARARVRVAGLGGADADAAGRYTVCLPPAIAWFNGTPVRAEAEGYGTIEIVVPGLNGNLHQDFELVPEAILVGVVVDEAGHPIAGAVVSAHPLVSESVHGAAGGSTATDIDGRFHIARLAPGKYRVAARADGLGTNAPILAVATAASSSRELRLVVTTRARIRGHVVMDGAPVAGARVGTAKTTIGGESMISAYSQADGSFVLDGADRGPATLIAPPYEVVSPRTVDVVGPELEVTVEVTRRAELHGRVTRHGQPVPGAGVRCSLVPGETRADAAGRYALVGVPSGLCDLSGYDVMAFTSKDVTVKTGEDQRIDLELDNGGDVQGTVVDAHGTPVPGVFVQMVSTDGQDQGGSMTDDRGGFDCATLTGHRDYQPGVYPTASRGAGYRSAIGGAFDTIHVKDGNDTVTGVVLAIKLERLVISGAVVDDTGASVPDAHIEAASGMGGWWGVRTARADVDGTFTVENLVAGSYTLKAHTADGGEGTVTGIEAGTTGVKIVIVRPGAIEGQLIGFEGLAPHVLADSLANQLMVVHEAVVDGDRFSFTGLPPGSYTVDALVGGVQLDGQQATVTSRATTQVTLHARPRATINGRVVESAGGAPVAQMRCRASASIDGREGPMVGDVLEVASDAQGSFVVSAPAGRARVTCLGHTYDPQLHAATGGDFDVIAGQPNPVEVVTARWRVPPSEPGFRFQWMTLPPTVATVDASGPAAAKGISVGDHVLSIDGLPVANILDATVSALITAHAPGTAAVLEVEHAGTTRKLQLVLAASH